jgi:hypothetical protein
VDYQEMLNEWLIRAWHSHTAHRMAAAQFERLHRVFGTVAAILSAIVGTTIFATLQHSPAHSIQIGVGLLSIAAGVLASLQTFLNYQELAEKHKIAAVRYGELRNEIERLLAFPPGHHQDNAAKATESLRDQWKTVNQESPIVSSSIDKRTRKQIASGRRAADKG